MCLDKRWQVGYYDGSGAGEDDDGVYIVVESYDDTEDSTTIVRGGHDDWGVAVGVLSREYADHIVDCHNAMLDAQIKKPALIKKMKEIIESLSNTYITVVWHNKLSNLRDQARSILDDGK